MLAKRAYDVYLRGCGIKRLRHGLKAAMNKALSSAIRQGRVVSEREKDRSGLINSTVRSAGAPATVLRVRGPRTFDEITPSEWRAVGQHVSEIHQLDYGSDEHLRATLQHFGLRRLTTHVGVTLLEILNGHGDQHPT